MVIFDDYNKNIIVDEKGIVAGDYAQQTYNLYVINIRIKIWFINKCKA